MQSTSILAYGAVLVAKAKDATFSAIVGAAVSQIAVMNYWGEAAVDGRKPQTLTTVLDGQRKAFGIAKGKTQANDWLAVASLIRKRIELNCADTLAIAKAAKTPEECFEEVLKDVKGQINGENTIEALRAWGSLGKVIKEAKVTSLFDKVMAMLGKRELSEKELSDIAAAVSDATHAMVDARLNARALADKLTIERQEKDMLAKDAAKAVIAKAKRDAAKAAKLAKAA